MSNSGIPIISDVAKGVGEVFSRPGDIFNDPGKFFGSAASAAAPFLVGPLAGLAGGASLPGWAGALMSTGGKMLSGQGQQNPINQYLPSYLGGAGLLGMLGGGNLANQMTSPFGIKLFPGGPYPDAGMGKQALDYADLLGGAGKSFLQQGQAGLPSLSNMGALSALPGIVQQQAQLSGVQDPFTGVNYGGSDPYALQPYQQQQFNTSADMVNQGRQASIQNVRQQLASQGINDPRAIAAAEAQINAAHDKMLTDTRTNLATQAYSNRQGALNQFAGMMPQLYGAQYGQQQGDISNALRFMGQPIGAYQTAADQAIRQNLYNQLNQGALLGNLLGYGTNPYNVPMIPGMGQSPYAGGMMPDLSGYGTIPGYPNSTLDPQTGQPIAYDPTSGAQYSPFESYDYPMNFQPTAGQFVDPSMLDPSMFAPSGALWGGGYPALNPFDTMGTTDYSNLFGM